MPPQPPLELTARRPAAEEEQVGRTIAVGRPESRQEYGGAAQTRNGPRPCMLATLASKGVPYISDARMRSQIINVPHEHFVPTAVTRHASFNAARSQRASHVHVEPGLKPEAPQPPDPDGMVT